MKVYVIKRNNNTYYKRYFENYVQFEDEIAFAEIYTKKSGAENTMDFITRNKYRFNILPKELSVVECDLMEPTELTDYTKQVRKEVCEEIRKFYTTPIYDRENAHTDVRVLLSRLDKIEKELLEKVGD